MPNLDPWINKNEVTNKFVNHLLSIRDERQNMIRPIAILPIMKPTKIIEMIDWFLEKYKTANTKMTNQENEEQEVIIIDNIIQ